MADKKSAEKAAAAADNKQKALEAALQQIEKTYGKGYYQTTYMLSDGSAVNLSIGKYFTPKGVNLTEAGGLTPDVNVAVDEETANKIAVNGISIQNDPQIQAAVAALQGK